MDDHTLVGRTIEIIGAVLAGGPAPSLAELTRRTGIPKPTLRRVANSLVDRQVLVHEGRAYGAGPRLLAYGMRALEQRGDRELAMPHLQEVLAQNPGSVVFQMDTRDPDHAALVSALFDRFGRQYADARWPHDLTQPAALATAMGRLVLSHYPDRIETLLRAGVPQLTGLTATTPGQVRLALARARGDGFAVEHQNVRRGWSCMTVPLPATGAPEQVLGLVAPTSRFDAARFARTLTQVAASIESDRASPTARGPVVSVPSAARGPDPAGPGARSAAPHGRPARRAAVRR